MWKQILKLVGSTKLSDIHIHADAKLAYRELGDMIQLDQIISSQQIRDFLQEVLSEAEFVEFIENKDFDFAI